MKNSKSLFGNTENVENVENNKRLFYTKKITAPIYKISGKKPQITELYDDSKSRELIRKIKNSNISEEEKKFLTNAAFRFTRFNFKDIADFYPYAEKETQCLMEDLALVVIDFNKSIQNGFLNFDLNIQSQIDNEEKIGNPRRDI